MQPRTSAATWRLLLLAGAGMAEAVACVPEYRLLEEVDALGAAGSAPSASAGAPALTDAGGAGSTNGASNASIAEPGGANSGSPSGGGAGGGGGLANPEGGAGSAGVREGVGGNDGSGGAAPVQVPCGRAGAACCTTGVRCQPNLTCLEENDAGVEGSCVPCVSLQDLGVLDAAQPNSAANGVSADGRIIVGASSSAVNLLPLTFASTAVLWRDGRAEPESIGSLGILSGTSNAAMAVNADGSVIAIQLESPGIPAPYVWRSSQPNEPQPLRPSSTTLGDFVYGLSGDGRFAVGAIQGNQPGGCLWTLITEGGQFRSTLFTRSDDITAAYGANSDGSVIVGEKNAGGFAFRWNVNTDVLTDLPPFPGTGATALAVNQAGTIIVGTEGGGSAPLLWRSDGPAERLDLNEDGRFTHARGTNADGTTIVGGDSTAWIWTPAAGLRTLADALSSAGVPVASQWRELTVATGISDDGRVVVGKGINAEDVPRGFRATLGSVLCEPP